MDELYKFTHNAFNWLASNIEANAALYEDPDADFDELLRSNVGEYREKSGVKIGDGIRLTPPDGSTSKRHLADRQALDFYHSLEGMTARLAVNPEILSYINHFYLHRYGIERWPRRGSTVLVQHIRDHWLTSSRQGTKMYKANIAGRTWWIAYMAILASGASNGAFEPKQALGVFARVPEYFHHSMEFAVLRNPTVMAECVRSLCTDANGINGTGYREMARELNLEAGAKLLDSLGQHDVRRMVRTSADRLMHDANLVTHRQYLKGVKPLKVLSLGAGTQSTVLALMAEEGWGGLEKPDLAVFADTQWEPPSVYKHLDWLEKQLSYKVVRVTAGNIRDNILNGVTPDGHAFLDIPVFMTDPDGKAGMASRQCTNHYKIMPIHAELRKVLGLEPGKRAPKDKQIEMWMGISADEPERKKPSRDEWITNRWPLLEMELTRAQLYKWFKERYPDRHLPRSACVGCPYHSNSEWKWLRDNEPESWKDAMFVDEAIRKVPNLRVLVNGEAYLHRDRQRLDSVNLDKADNYDDMMNTECEGLCGI